MDTWKIDETLNLDNVDLDKLAGAELDDAGSVVTNQTMVRKLFKDDSSSVDGSEEVNVSGSEEYEEGSEEGEYSEEEEEDEYESEEDEEGEYSEDEVYGTGGEIPKLGLKPTHSRNIMEINKMAKHLGADKTPFYDRKKIHKDPKYAEEVLNALSYEYQIDTTSETFQDFVSMGSKLIEQIFDGERSFFGWYAPSLEGYSNGVAERMHKLDHSTTELAKTARKTDIGSLITSSATVISVFAMPAISAISKNSKTEKTRRDYKDMDNLEDSLDDDFEDI